MIIDFSKELKIEKVKILFSNKEIKNFPSEQKIVSMNQVHSSKIIEVSKEKLNYDSVDGLISTDINNILEISVADCLPIFILNQKKFKIGVLHAGWRGLKNGIIRNLTKVLNINNESYSDFKIFIGPSISQKNYEVKKDFLKYFDEEFFLIINGRYFLDLKKIAVEQLNFEGFKNIKVSEMCTFDNLGFHSFRRNKTKKRMKGYIYCE